MVVVGGDDDDGHDRGGDDDGQRDGQHGVVGGQLQQHDGDGGGGDGQQQQQHGGDGGRRCGGGGLGRATIDVSEIISPLTNFLLSIGVTRGGIITLLKSNVVINTFDLHVLSKKPAHEGQKSSSPHNFTIALPLHYAANDTQHFFHYI